MKQYTKGYKSNFILDYDTAPAEIKKRLIPFKILDRVTANKLHQVIYIARHKENKSTAFFNNVIYETKNEKGYRNFFMDRVKHFENISKVENESIKKDELIGAALERLDEVGGTKLEIVEAIVKAGLKPNKNSAYQVFYYTKSLKVAQFIYNYVKNKYGYGS